jgi:serine/threonine protein kinase
MGVVVAAHHIGLDERVAIKLLRPEMLGNGEAVARFEREARAAVKIKSEHVARVLDLGVLDDGAPYLVMEFLAGIDLAKWLRQQGRLPIEQTVEFVLQACEAIAEAHTLGIIHRDLKPANLFITRRPDGASALKVLDFGISKMRTGSVPDISITKTSAIMGSPLYMSPEQMQSAKDVDARTDIWALGIILWELVIGRPPFHGDSVPEIMAKILTMPLPRLGAQRADLPEGFEAVVLKCLSKDRNQRFSTVQELARSLSRFGSKRARVSLDRISGLMRVAGIATGIPLPPSSDPSSSAAPAGTEAAWGATKVPARRTALVVGSAIVVVVIVAAVLSMLKRSERAALSSTSSSRLETAPGSGEQPTGSAQYAPTVSPMASSVGMLAETSATSNVALGSSADLAARGATPAPRKMGARARPAPLTPGASPVTPPDSTPRPAGAFDDRK